MPFLRDGRVPEFKNYTSHKWTDWVDENISKWFAFKVEKVHWNVLKMYITMWNSIQIYKYMKCNKVRNGCSTFAWLDNWHPLGPLYQRFGERVCSNIGMSLNAKVSSLIHNGTWKWPRGRRRITQEIKDNTPEGFLPVVIEDDSMIWCPSNSSIFTMKSVWAAIRSTSAVQELCKVVWFSKHVPCWAFILWLAMQSKMNTRDRLLKWSNFWCIMCLVW